jgi:hypothetical protein
MPPGIPHCIFLPIIKEEKLRKKVLISRGLSKKAYKGGINKVGRNPFGELKQGL